MTTARAQNYREIGDTTLAVFQAELDRLGSPWRAKAASIYAIVSPHAALALAMGSFENKWGTTGHIIKPADNNPFSSRPWDEDPRATADGVEIAWDTRKPTGRLVAVPPGAAGTVMHPKGGSFLRFATIEAAALEWRRRLFDDPGYKGGVYTTKRTLKEMIDTYSPPGDVHPVTGADNADIQYVASVQAMLDRYQAAEGEVPAPVTGGGTMSTWRTVIPGLPGGPLTTNHPVFIDLIPARHTRQRPGIKAGYPRRGVQHGSGNGDSTARSEANYVVRVIANSAQTSYHSSTDDAETGVFVPLDEVTWQAADGSGPGNMCGFSNEMAENEAIWADPVRRYNMIDNAANFMGGVAAHLEIAVPEQHWTFNFADPNRHNCPNFLRNRYHNGRRAWDIYVELWAKYKAEELARLGGATIGFTIGDRVRLTRPHHLNRSPDGPELVNLPPGVEATIIDGPKFSQYQAPWYDLQFAPEIGTGFIPADALEEVATPVPAPEPTPAYAPALPIKALLGTDLAKNDTAVGIVTDEANTFVFVADVIEVTADRLPALQYAGGERRRRADLVKGERFVGAWLVKAGDGKHYYITPAPDWWRVPYEGTRRVADAPLLPGSERD